MSSGRSSLGERDRQAWPLDKAFLFRGPENPDARLRCVARSGDSGFLGPLSATTLAINEIVVY